MVGQIVRLATEYGRYGYRRITALLRNDGWRVNHKRVERIWRREGLKVPQKQPKRGRLWLNDGSCIRLRPERKDHVWSYNMVMERTSDGRPLRILAVIDEYTRECLALHVARRIRSGDVLDELYELFLRRGMPEYKPQLTREMARFRIIIVELGGEVRPDNRLAAAGAGRFCLCEPLSGAPGCP